MHKIFKKFITMTIVFSLASGLFFGCGVFSYEAPLQCSVVIEETEGITLEESVFTVNYGEDLIFTGELSEGYSLDSVDYESAVISGSGSEVTVTLRDVKYSETISLSVSDYPIVMTCYSNDGTDLVTEVRRKETGNKINTPSAGLFEREGFTQIGWNTAVDGSGTFVGSGSRVAVDSSGEISLFALWMPWTSEECFAWTDAGNYAVVTGYDSSKNPNPGEVVIPQKLGGKEVISIEEGAIEDAHMNVLVLPESLQTIKDGAIAAGNLKELYLFDGIRSMSDRSFECDSLTTLHINAMEEPVYSNTYFAAFADKYERLCAIRDTKKIVLFSGSSARFGYDSEMIKEAFPEYEVENMGVFAYTNGYPQTLMILEQMNEGDIFLDSPEFDAAKRQFFTTNELDDSFFCMMEANYDMLLDLDLRKCTKVFSSLNTYLSDKEGMEAKSYDLSPADYDEDQNRVNEKSYNEYGDYILYRPNSDSDDPIYGLEVKYTVEAYPYETYIKPANEMFSLFLAKGISVYMTYSPRNSQAIDPDSTREKREALDSYFRENLIVPVISDLEGSLYPGRYMYGTDNHLSTEGVTLRTNQVILDLKKQMEGGSE